MELFYFAQKHYTTLFQELKLLFKPIPYNLCDYIK